MNYMRKKTSHPMEFIIIREQEERLLFNKDLLFKVKNLQFSNRIHNALRYENIIYVGDLVQKTEKEILFIPQIGRKCLKDMKEVLCERDLEFGMTIQNWPIYGIEELSEKYEMGVYDDE